MNVEPGERERRGTGWQRFLIAIFSVALSLLIFWLLGFALQDIGRLRGPDWTDVEAERLDPQLRKSADRIRDESAAVGREIENQERRQKLLRDSTASSQKTLTSRASGIAAQGQVRGPHPG